MKKLHRRTVLRGMGAAIALPWLEAMSGTSSTPNRLTELTTATASPKRVAFMYIPNGVIGSEWFPQKTGSNFDLPPTLQPLADHQADITVISGLNRTYLTGEPHSQAGSCWLTSALPNERTNGISAIDTTLDQLIAKEHSRLTAFPSMELSCNTFVDNMEPKVFDAISWYASGHDAKSSNDPHKVFKRLFGKATPIKRSVLDTVIDDAKRLEKSLGVNDRQKLDEYMTSIRAIENRMIRQRDSKHKLGKINFTVPEEVPTNRGEYIRLMGDLMVLAFQTDQTRIATMMVGPERWQTPQFYEGVFEKPISHHVLTHDPDFDDVVAKVDRFHVAQYAYLINRLKNIQEGEGSLLDSCSFVLGSGIGNGAIHSYEQLPVIVAGSGGGVFKTGHHLTAAKGTPLANLWLSLAGNMGVKLDRFADSTERLKGLA
ncbi:MAG: DUF1552 domain-containing protein [Mariniblastus sp.]|nr:DUF1552 domain-containing protein [Mariniblastus sp.]